MPNEMRYHLFGYLDYLMQSMGFVTPVFRNEQGELFTQVEGMTRRRMDWEPLLEEYADFVCAMPGQSFSQEVDGPIYAFKWNGGAIYKQGADMAAFLKDKVIREHPEAQNLVNSFIETWSQLELINQPFTKEEVWALCLQIAAKKSARLSRIFEKELKVISFVDSLLVLDSEIKSIRKLFESKFQELIITEVANEIPNLKISFLDKANISVTPSPFVYYGGEGSESLQGSYIRQTSLNPYQDFDNFVIGEFNEVAFLRTQELITSNQSPIIGIKGTAGVGKSHFVNAIAHQCRKSDLKVGFYKVLSPLNNPNAISESEIEVFGSTAADLDVIIIDDLHKISGKRESLDRAVQLLKRWSNEGKRVVVSYPDSKLEMDIVPMLRTSAEELALNVPKEADKSKIIRSKIVDYNIRLSNYEIDQLAKNIEIFSIADLQKHLLRSVLTGPESFRTIDYFSITHRDYDHIDWTTLELSISSHFSSPNHLFANKGDQVRTLSAKMVSHFIKELFATTRHGTSFSAPIVIHEGALFQYSFEYIQHQLFENKEFKEVIIEILRDFIKSNF